MYSYIEGRYIESERAAAGRLRIGARTRGWQAYFVEGHKNGSTGKGGNEAEVSRKESKRAREKERKREREKGRGESREEKRREEKRREEKRRGKEREEKRREEGRREGGRERERGR